MKFIGENKFLTYISYSAYSLIGQGEDVQLITFPNSLLYTFKI